MDGMVSRFGLYSGLVIIISQNSSKSMEPEPSSSSSSRMPSTSSSVRGASSSVIRPLRVSVVMNPWPSRSYSLKASFSSLFMVSMSGSSTRKVAQSWQNSPISISPDPSSSISSNKDLSSSSVGRNPIALMISPRSSADRKSCFFVSKRSKQTFRHLISSTARPVASLISSKSIPSYGSGILILVLAAARVLKKSQVVSVQAE